MMAQLPEQLAGSRQMRVAPFRALFVVMIVLAGCTTVLVRSPVPEASLDEARPYGMKQSVLRMWGDSPARATVEAVVEERADVFQQIIRRQIAAGKPPEFVSLALSGGGSDGAFGAGLLGGWTRRGDRPEFHLVTGISTGAIIAVFAFLGSEYDDDLRQVYTTYTTSDLFTRTIFAALTGGSAVLDASGYRSLLEYYIDDAVVAQLAEAYHDGRMLLIGTTNIDASRPVIWNIGAIAASGAPNSKKLIHDVIQASSAIPAAFPPVLIPVEANGRKYDEMHVDGGATQQVMLYSPGIPTRWIDEAIGTRVQRKAYVIINNKLDKAYDPVQPRLVAIARQALDSLISGSGSGDIYRIYALAQRDKIELNVMSIPRTFDREPDELFDPAYMRALYELGYEMGYKGEGWQAYPPDFEPRKTDTE